MAKQFVKMVAKLIFERAVMLGIFTGSLVLYNHKIHYNTVSSGDSDSIVMHRDIRPLTVIGISDSDSIMIVIIWHDSQP